MVLYKIFISDNFFNNFFSDNDCEYGPKILEYIIILKSFYDNFHITAWFKITSLAPTWRNPPLH